MINSDNVKVLEYNVSENFKDFQCKKKGYSDFLQDMNEAYKCRLENLNVTYIFKIRDRCIGYVSLAMGSLKRERLPKSRSDKKRFGDVPSLLLGQITRDNRYKGQGVGKIMIDWVFDKAHKLFEVIGCRFIIINAELDKEQRYKIEYGFESIPRKKGDKTALMFFDLGIQTNSPIKRV